MKISVLLPNYNHSAYIGQSIEAILAQTHENFEILILDDGSTDTSREVIGGYADKDQRIKSKFFSVNRGVNSVLADGLAAANGDLLYSGAADDYIEDPHFFADAVSFLGKQPEAAGVFGKTRVIDAVDGRELFVMGTAPLPGFNEGQAFLDAFLASSAFVPGSSAIWRRDLVQAAGGYQCELGPQSDYFINHALPSVHGVCFIDRAMTVMRWSAASFSGSATDNAHFRHHTLVEAKLRAYAVNRAFSRRAILMWRANIVKARLAASAQRPFFDTLRMIVVDALAFLWAALPPAFVELVHHTRAKLLPSMVELKRRIATAYAYFRGHRRTPRSDRTTSTTDGYGGRGQGVTSSGSDGSGPDPDQAPDS